MEIPRHWRLKQQRYGLVGEICPHCNFKIFPPGRVCPYCNDQTNSSNTTEKTGGINYKGLVFIAPQVTPSSD